MTDLFSPIKVGDYDLKNRIFMAPLTRARSLPGAIPKTDLKAEYYSQRAEAGLIIAEATSVSPNGIGWLDTCGIWNDEQENAWRPVTEAVHKKGSKIFVQIWHMGAVVPTDFIGGDKPISASNVKLSAELRTPKGRKQTLEEPHALTIDEIQAVQQEFVDGAIRAVRAGFDGVEIHAANGFLIDQFLRDGTNKRNDKYGGSIENRLRFCLEIVEKTCSAIGSGKVGIRISPTNKVWGIADSDHRATFGKLVEKLNEYDLAYLHILEPKPNSGHDLETIDYMTPIVREKYKGTFIVNGGFNQETGHKAIKDGLGDAVAFGAPWIANPDLVSRFKKQSKLAAPDVATFYTNDAEGYIDYPALSA